MQMPAVRFERCSMRYKLSKDIIIRTENAAKPEKQLSSYLATLISRLEPVSSSFDYGCGKLRYQNVISKTTDTLAVVDSEIQLSRDQMIHGRMTSIRSLMRRSNRIYTFNVPKFGLLPDTFDRGFCLNVLSVIPSQTARLRVLQLIRSKLRPGSPCLFVVQYRNSDFTRMISMPNTKPWGDGFLIDSLHGYSFYGLISPDRLTSLIRRAGFEIAEHHLYDGSAFIWGRNPVQNVRLPKLKISETKDNFQISIRE